LNSPTKITRVATQNVAAQNQLIETFFQAVYLQFSQDPSRYSFQTLIRTRQLELQTALPHLAQGNLERLFCCQESSIYIATHALKPPLDGLRQIEEQAIALFGNLLCCWAEYEKFLITHQAQAPYCSTTSLSKDENRYHSEIVSAIEHDSRLFHTLHHHEALRLSEAIRLINLDIFIIEQKWYEMLFCLDLSSRGCHFILTTNAESGSPLLVSSALIQDWSQRKNWLSFDGFFDTPNWQPCTQQHDGQSLLATGVFNQQILGEIQCENEQDFARYLKEPDAICEVLRLTVSGTKAMRFALLYLCQKHLMKRLVESGKKLTFTIIEQPLMLDFYYSLDTVCYVNRTCRDINQTGVITYKGFWLNEALHHAFEQCTFSRYKTQILKQRKTQRETSVV